MGSVIVRRRRVAYATDVSANCVRRGQGPVLTGGATVVIIVCFYTYSLYDCVMTVISVGSHLLNVLTSDFNQP